MDTPAITFPTLIEPGARYFFKETLKKCHETKSVAWNKLINVGLLVMFVSMIGLWMWWNYGEKQKKIAELYDGTAERRAVEAESEMLRILGNVERERMRMEGSLITELPTGAQIPAGFSGVMPSSGGIELPAPPPNSGMYGLPPPILPPVPVPAPAAGIALPPALGSIGGGGANIQTRPSGFESMYAMENKKFI
jgi:hypothetical protein